MLSHLQRKVFLVKLLFVDFSDEVVEELLAHVRLTGEEMHAVVGACEE